MIKHPGRAAVLSVVGSALVLSATGAAQAAPQLTASGWRIDKTIAIRGKVVTLLTGVDAVSRGDAWATGFSESKKARLGLVIMHWAGRRWQSARLPAALVRKLDKAGYPFAELAASSAGNVWDFADLGGRYLRLDGRHWSTGSLPGMRNGLVSDALAVSPSDIWALGAKINPRTGVFTPYAANFDGDRWTPESVPGSGAVVAASVASGGDIWALVRSIASAEAAPLMRADSSVSDVMRAAASSGGTSVVQWTGTSWQTAATQPTLAAGAELTSIVAQSDTDVWVSGGEPNAKKGMSELAEQWNGATWTVDSPPVAVSKAKNVLDELAADGSGGLWGVAVHGNAGRERIWHLSGGTWSEVMPHFGKHHWALEQLALVPGTKSVWAVGLIVVRSKGDGLIAVDGPLPR